MAEYRTIRIGFWHDPYIEELEVKGKLLYIYLFTGPYANNLGIVEATRRKISYETALTVQDVDKYLSMFEADGKVVCDAEHNLIFLSNFIRHQSSTSPKILDGLRKLAPAISSPVIAKALCIRYPDVYGVRKDEADTVCIPYANGIHTLCIPSGEIGSWKLEVGKGKVEDGKSIAQSPPALPEGFRAEGGTCVCSAELARTRQEENSEPPEERFSPYFLPVKSPGMSEVAYIKAQNWKTWLDSYGEELCLSCLKNAYRWSLDTPDKAKTAKGIHKFLGDWIAREQNRGNAPSRASPSTPIATTQHQKGRQDQENMAKFVIAADKEFAHHGDFTANHNGIGTNGNALSPANEPGRTSSPSPVLDGIVRRTQ